MSRASALYVGTVRHRRFRPKPHALAYRVFWMLLDLDEIDRLSGGLRWFSRNRWNLFGFRDADYGDRSGAALRPQVERLLSEARIEGADGAIRLLTMPRILGYAFNPLSTYFCHGRDGHLRAIVYEVHNTFGETHSYVVPARDGAPLLDQEAEKVFHVSPFMGLSMRYAFRVVPPGERVSVTIDGRDEQGRLICATMSGRRRALDDRALLLLLASHPLLTLKVTAAIHWHALRLLAKGIRWRSHPGPPARAASGGRLVHPQAVEGAPRR